MPGPGQGRSGRTATHTQLTLCLSPTPPPHPSLHPRAHPHQPTPLPAGPPGPHPPGPHHHGTAAGQQQPRWRGWRRASPARGAWRGCAAAWRAAPAWRRHPRGCSRAGAAGNAGWRAAAAGRAAAAAVRTPPVAGGVPAGAAVQCGFVLICAAANWPHPPASADQRLLRPCMLPAVAGQPGPWLRTPPGWLAGWLAFFLPMLCCAQTPPSMPLALRLLHKPATATRLRAQGLQMPAWLQAGKDSAA